MNKRNFTRLVLGLVAATGVGVGLATQVGSSKWNCKTKQLVENLKQSISTRETKTVTFKDFDLLPTPVAKYFRLVLKEGQPFINFAQISHQGMFRKDDKWIPFKSTQHFSSMPHGFVWDAQMNMFPFVDVRVRDVYLNGHGSMRAKLLSLVPVVDEHDKAELNKAALQRYLAELVWLPTALLPGEGIKWSPIDNNKALATLTDSGTTISLEFSFNNAGEITSVFTPGRYREVNGKYELTPWTGRFSHYEERNGIMIPLKGEVEWQLPYENHIYWKGQIANIEYDFA